MNFPKGGMYKHFGKKGKAWTSSGAIKNHLRQYIGLYSDPTQNLIPKEWEIWEYSGSEIIKYSAHESYNQHENHFTF